MAVRPPVRRSAPHRALYPRPWFGWRVFNVRIVAPSLSPQQTRGLPGWVMSYALTETWYSWINYGLTVI